MGGTSRGCARELAASLIVISLAAAPAAGCGTDDGSDPAPPADATGAGDPAAPAPGAPPAPAAAPAPAPAPPAAPRLRVWFKLDPRLTDGAYMGERWVSPPRYHAAAQAGSTFSAQARVEQQTATWTPSDGAVAVLPAAGRQVDITISSPGRSTLTVAAGEDTATVTVDATHANGTWLVIFTQ
jgi:hypothetical protein